MANVEAMHQNGEPIKRIVATGGLANVNGLCQRIANIAGMPVTRAAEIEATARGLAWLLSDEPRDWPEEQAGTVFEPKPDTALRERHRRWRELVEARL
jgi:glycerol kinase